MGTEPAVDPAVLDRLVETSFAVMAVLNQVAAAHDLSLTQLRVLAILRDRTPPISHLAGHLGLEKSSVSGLLDRAERRGLVVRRPADGDRRVVQVVLTAAGRELAERGAAEVAARIGPLVGRLEPNERARLAAALSRMNAGAWPGGPTAGSAARP